MKTLGMDTTHKYLVIALYENDTCIAGISENAWKKQSEKFFPALMKCMNEVGWSADDLDQVVLTEGPGSYTGERIAMTIGKVLCTTKNIPLYTISTFQLYAGNKDCEVMLDARSNRAYCGVCKDGQVIDESIKTLDVVKEEFNSGITLVGDVDLIGNEIAEIDFIKNMLDVKEHWKKIENVHTLTPHYLKSQEELVQ